jgi:hypothetical protein
MVSQLSFIRISITKMDLLGLSSVLHARKLDKFYLNFGEIILLPKVNEAERIKQYISICLLNVSFKIFKKTTTIKMNSVADHVVCPTQTAFAQGINILDG